MISPHNETGGFWNEKASCRSPFHASNPQTASAYISQVWLNARISLPIFRECLALSWWPCEQTGRAYYISSLKLATTQFQIATTFSINTRAKPQTGLVYGDNQHVENLLLKSSLLQQRTAQGSTILALLECANMSSIAQPWLISRYAMRLQEVLPYPVDHGFTCPY
jgi:hypothetical protein